MFVWAKIKPEHLKGEGTIDFCLRMMDEAEFRFTWPRVW